MSNTYLEIVKPWNREDFDVRYALFDFDGTVSLIRQGWQEIMIPYFTEVLQAVGTDETYEQLYDIVKLFVTDLTGKQTIFQCIRLAEEVTKRGGQAEEPIAYKQEYLRRLDEKIQDRKEMLKSGQSDPDEWTVPGIRSFLSKLREKGIRLYLASGTDDADVQAEAALLKLSEYFDGGIWGARDQLFAKVDEIKEIKAEVIKDMLENQQIRPSQLISFGDGYVEVELVANLGGLTVGVASNEEERCGINEWKRSRLLVAGARAVVPDFSEPDQLIELL